MLLSSLVVHRCKASLVVLWNMTMVTIRSFLVVAAARLLALVLVTVVVVVLVVVNVLFPLCS